VLDLFASKGTSSLKPYLPKQNMFAETVPLLMNYRFMNERYSPFVNNNSKSLSKMLISILVQENWGKSQAEYIFFK
jgi:hypothetical protein